MPTCCLSLELTCLGDDGVFIVSDLARLAAGGFNGLDDSHRFIISNLAEDNVLPIEPAGHHCRDKELRAVAKAAKVSRWVMCRTLVEICSRIRSRIGH